jgi:hypothetical protein
MGELAVLVPDPLASFISKMANSSSSELRGEIYFI